MDPMALSCTNSGCVLLEIFVVNQFVRKTATKIQKRCTFLNLIPNEISVGKETVDLRDGKNESKNLVSPIMSPPSIFNTYGLIPMTEMIMVIHTMLVSKMICEWFLVF